MRSATFFGHRDYDYKEYRTKIRDILEELIQKRGVKTFLSGYRGNFDRLCAETVFELKRTYPGVQNLMVLSYHNPPDFVLPEIFDESLYLLERRIPPRYAIYATNREMVLRSDFVLSGVRYAYGGAYAACRFAKQRKKTILSVFEDRENFF